MGIRGSRAGTAAAVARSSSTTWEGRTYELELAGPGIRRGRTLDLMANAAGVRYTVLPKLGLGYRR